MIESLIYRYLECIVRNKQPWFQAAWHKRTSWGRIRTHKSVHRRHKQLPIDCYFPAPRRKWSCHIHISPRRPPQWRNRHPESGSSRAARTWAPSRAPAPLATRIRALVRSILVLPSTPSIWGRKHPVCTRIGRLLGCSLRVMSRTGCTSRLQSE